MKQDINKLRDESPVDELFARRLARHSVTPDKAAWARLQTRLAAGDSAPRVVLFWQNPTMQRYAAAACVTLLLLVGGWWFLQPSDVTTVAQNQRVAPLGKAKRSLDTIRPDDRKPSPIAADPQPSPITRQTQSMVARNTRSLPMPKPAGQAVASTKRPQTKPAPAPAPTVEKPAEQLAQTNSKPLTTSAIAVAKTTEKPITGRVLVVTIAEPDALIEARQAANWSESAETIIVMDAAPKPARDSSRLAQRRRGSRGAGVGAVSTDDQSLLNLAYRAIKNKVTTNKSLKQ